MMLRFSGEGHQSAIHAFDRQWMLGTSASASGASRADEQTHNEYGTAGVGCPEQEKADHLDSERRRPDGEDDQTDNVWYLYPVSWA